MQRELLDYIDLLVEMSGSNSNVEMLKVELDEILDRSKKIKREIEKISSFGDDKYLNSSDRLIDENIKISLEAKVRKIKKSLSELKDEIRVSEDNKDCLEANVNEINNRVSKLLSFIEELKKKLEVSVTDTEINNYYKEMISDQTERLSNLENELVEKNGELDQLVDELEHLYLADQEISEQLSSKEEKLRETNQSLGKKTSYVDIDLKKTDEVELGKYEEELDILEKRRLEILIDPVMIGDDAKELYLDNDLPSCLSKVKELVTLVKDAPYMDIESSEELEMTLQNEMIKSERQRDEFATALENKKYDTSNSVVAENRIARIRDYINNLNRKKENILNEVDRIDREDIRVLQDEVATARVIKERLSLDIEDYKKILVEDENCTPKKKAALIAALKKKEEDLELTTSIIEDYEDEIAKYISQSIELVQVDLVKLDEEIEECNDKIMKLTKKIAIRSKTKDILAIEKDKEELKELSLHVNEIQHRMKFKKTPSEIFDEIEVTFGNLIEAAYMDEDMEKDEEDETPFELNEPILEDETPELIVTESNDEPLIEEEQIEEEQIEEESDVTNQEEDSNINNEFEIEEPTDSIQESSNEIEDEQDLDSDLIFTINENEPISLSMNDVTIEPVNTDPIFEEPIKQEEPVIIEEPVKEKIIEEIPSRLKVIKIEPLNTNETKPKVEEEAEYIDFNNYIGEGDFL